MAWCLIKHMNKLTSKYYSKVLKHADRQFILHGIFIDLILVTEWGLEECQTVFRLKIV